MSGCEPSRCSDASEKPRIVRRRMVASPLQPLRETRVLDLTSSLAGPYCTQTLAALGAEVVKVEHPQRGDETRQWGPPFWDGEGAIFLAANAGKRSFALDFHADAGKEALLRLVECADVVVQSLRPGHAERIALGSDELRARNPRLVYCSIGAFGRVGPRSEQAGYDPLMQAAGGIISVTGEPGRPGVRVGVSVVDQTTGMWAALGIVAALWERERTGEGTVVDVSLYETVIGLVGYHLVGYLGSGEVPGRHGTAFPLIAPYEVFAARDGEIMIAAANDRLFGALCDVVGSPELRDDPRFATNPDRVANRDELVSLLGARFIGESASTWLERLDRAGVPAAPVHDVAEVAVDEQTRALGILQPLEHPSVRELETVALPLSADRERVRHGSAPPLLGEHTGEVLTELGYSPADIDELARVGVVRLGSELARES
jgi:crotonobetainyl-CoA:carnitine CoA-transferase CaiB-like acyl-CoA transferase